jgi:hypothetical protein
MLDEEFDVLDEEHLALLSRRFQRMYTNRKNARRSSGMCYWCGKHGHFIVECPEAMEVKPEYKHRSRNDHKHRSRQLQGQEQVQAEVEKEWWSQEGASDGGRCERHRLKLLLLFIEFK